jgi:hypothetical protein
VAGEQGDVLPPVAQRRQVHLDGVEAEQQVLPESAGGDLGVQVGVGGRDQPHADLSRLRRAEPLELAGLDDAQQLLLLRQRDVGDFVEEQRAAVGQLEPADAVGLSRR